MKLKLLSLIALLAIVSFKGYGQCWVETWSDEFNETSLDQTKWDYDLGDGCQVGNCGWGNNELQYYTNGTNNITVSGGQLAITAKYEPNYNGTGKNYTSARLVTRGKNSQKYGRYEARIKVPSAGGVWPAFWTLGDNISTVGWPKCGEIDIMETQNDASKLWNTVHYASARRGTHSYKGIIKDYPAGLSNDFHIYAIEWDTQEIRWYFDGALSYKVTKAEITGSGGAWSFDQNFHILLNVAVGGNFAGSGNVVSSDYPAAMIVDYVKVFQLGACTPTSFVNITSPANNASFNSGTDITTTADALIVDGSVSKVEFFSDNVKIGEDSISPYSITWTGAAIGTHSLTATATDAQGGTLTSSPVSVTVYSQTPFLGTPGSIPGRIEAENYDLGGSGISYNDLSAGNSGNIFRTDHVDIEATTDLDGAYNITGVQAGEWLEYTVDVATPGTYTIAVRLAAPSKKYNLHIELDGQLIGSVSNTKPNGTTQWQTVSFTSPSLTAGQKVMRIVMNQDGAKLNYVNFTLTANRSANIFSTADNASLNAIELYPNPTNNTSLVKLNAADASNAEVSVVNAMGIEIYKGKLSNNSEGTINLAGMENGIYVVKIIANGQVYIEKLLKE